MNPPNKLWKIALPLFLVIVFASLMIAYWEELFDYFIMPIAILFWQVWQILTSVDQIIYWAILIFVCLFFVFRLIPIRKKALPKLAYRSSPRPPNRVEYWAALFAEASRGKNEREYLRSNLQKLYVSMIMQVRRVGMSDAQELIEQDKLALSPEARQFLFPENRKNEKSAPAAFHSRWMRWMKTENSHPSTSGIEEILDWMEHDLEITNEQ